MSADWFDEHADRYELLIDWPRRLANEGPFFRRLFEQHGVRRVLDTACGTGHHASLFQSWGLEVEGADLSPAMIEAARRQFGEPSGLRWAVRPFQQPAEPPGSFDAVLCIGNSLALAPDQQALAQALAAMVQSARPEGLIILHLLNLQAIPAGPLLWQKCRRVSIAGRQHLLLKGIHRTDGGARIEFIDIDLDTTDPQRTAESTALLAIDAGSLSTAARAAGASPVGLFGDHRQSPYDPAASSDLIMLLTAGR